MATSNSTTFELYLNGSQIASGWLGDVSSDVRRQTPVFIGSLNATYGRQMFVGDLQDIVLYPLALDADSIRLLAVGLPISRVMPQCLCAGGFNATGGSGLDACTNGSTLTPRYALYFV